MMLNQHRLGTLLLWLSAVIGVLMLFCDWYLVPYVTKAGAAGFLTIKLADVIFHTASMPANAAESIHASPVAIGEAAFYLLGTIGCVALAVATRHGRHSSAWVFGIALVYLLVLAVFLTLRQMEMGLQALNAPYIGIKATIYQWLLLPFGGGILFGTSLLNAPQKAKPTA